jgi:hypothetical protein
MVFSLAESNRPEHVLSRSRLSPRGHVREPGAGVRGRIAGIRGRIPADHVCLEATAVASQENALGSPPTAFAWKQPRWPRRETRLALHRPRLLGSNRGELAEKRAWLAADRVCLEATAVSSQDNSFSALATRDPALLLRCFVLIAGGAPAGSLPFPLPFPPLGPSAAASSGIATSRGASSPRPNSAAVRAVRRYVLIMVLDLWPVRSAIHVSVLPLAKLIVMNVARVSWRRICRRVALVSKSSARSTPASSRRSRYCMASCRERGCGGRPRP